MASPVLVLLFVISLVQSICLDDGSVQLGVTDLVLGPGRTLTVQCADNSSFTYEDVVRETYALPHGRLVDVSDLLSPDQVTLGYGNVIEYHEHGSDHPHVVPRPLLPVPQMPEDRELLTRIETSPVGSDGYSEILRTEHGSFGELWVLWMRIQSETAFTLELLRCTNHECDSLTVEYTRNETLLEKEHVMGADLFLVDQVPWLVYTRGVTDTLGVDMYVVNCDSTTNCSVPVERAHLQFSTCRPTGRERDSVSHARISESIVALVFGCYSPGANEAQVRSLECPVADTCLSVDGSSSNLIASSGISTDAVQWLQALVNVDTGAPDVAWVTHESSDGSTRLRVTRCVDTACDTLGLDTVLSHDPSVPGEKVGAAAVARQENGVPIVVFADYNLEFGAPYEPAVQAVALTSHDATANDTLARFVVGFESGDENYLYTRPANGTGFSEKYYGLYDLQRDRQGRLALLYQNQERRLQMRWLASRDGFLPLSPQLIQMPVSQFLNAAQEPIQEAALAYNVDGLPLVFYSCQSDTAGSVLLRRTYCPNVWCLPYATGDP